MRFMGRTEMYYSRQKKIGPFMIQRTRSRTPFPDKERLGGKNVHTKRISFGWQRVKSPQVAIAVKKIGKIAGQFRAKAPTLERTPASSKTTSWGHRLGKQGRTFI